MQTTLRYSATVQPGHRIEITSPEFAVGACVELIVSETPVELLHRYPPALEAEYQALIDKELDRTLSEEEAVRLQDICNVIAEIDRLTLTNDIRTQRLNQLEAELAQLREEIEALSEA